jgi:hypothetical protein
VYGRGVGSIDGSLFDSTSAVHLSATCRSELGSIRGTHVIKKWPSFFFPQFPSASVSHLFSRRIALPDPANPTISSVPCPDPVDPSEFPPADPQTLLLPRRVPSPLAHVPEGGCGRCGMADGASIGRRAVSHLKDLRRLLHGAMVCSEYLYCPARRIGHTHPSLLPGLHGFVSLPRLSVDMRMKQLLPPL